jgi:hypothetical protein
MPRDKPSQKRTSQASNKAKAKTRPSDRPSREPRPSQAKNSSVFLAGKKTPSPLPALTQLTFQRTSSNQLFKIFQLHYSNIRLKIKVYLNFFR